MKTIKKIAVIIAVIFSSCDMVVDSYLTDQALGHNLTFREEWLEFDNYYDIGAWIENNVEYRSDKIYEWTDPETVINRGYGDCNDKCLLFANIAYVAFGVKMDIVVVNQSSMEFEPMWSIEEGGIVDHCMLRLDWQIYSYTGGTYTGPVGFYYTFNQCWNGF